MIELNEEQLKRNDDIYNSVFEMCKVMTENDDLEWDMNIIGDIAEYAVQKLINKNYAIRFPSIVSDGDNEYVEEFYNPQMIHIIK